MSIETPNESSYQKKEPDLTIAQQIKTNVKNLENRSEEFSFVTVQQPTIKTKADSSSRTETIPQKQSLAESTDIIEESANTDIPAENPEKLHLASLQVPKISTDAFSTKKTGDKVIQELTDFSMTDHLPCEGFSKPDWRNKELSIEQSIQYFTKQQMKNLLSINKEFPSTKDKENSIRCFVNTAFSLSNILGISTNGLWKDVKTPLQTSHKETLVEFMEHFFTAHIGYTFLRPIKPISSGSTSLVTEESFFTVHVEYIFPQPIKSISSGSISVIVKEPFFIKNNKYKVITKVDITVATAFKIRKSYEVTWIVDSQFFPNELFFLDTSIDGVSMLHLLRSQMAYLFQKKNRDLNEIALALQNFMDSKSLTDL